MSTQWAASGLSIAYLVHPHLIANIAVLFFVETPNNGAIYRGNRACTPLEGIFQHIMYISQMRMRT